MKNDYEYIYVFMCNEQNIGLNQSITITNQSIENMLEFRYFGNDSRTPKLQKRCH